MNRFILIFLVSLILVFTCKTGTAQLNEKSIETARRYSAAGAGLGLIVWEKGETRIESYYNGHSAEKPIHIYSGTKSFFGVLAAIAVDEGWLDLNELVAKTIPEWSVDKRKRNITIRDLLNFTSGLESGASQIYSRTTADKLTLSLNLKATHDRQVSFIYGPGHLQVFCEILRRKLARKGITYEAYLRAKIIAPLGIDITRWTKDARGNVIPSAGMYLTGRDWLKFGQMIVQEGQTIIKKDALQRCFTGTPINPAYGLTFWLNGYASHSDARVVDVEKWLDREPMPTDWSRACLSKSAPPDMVVALGSNFQRLYMIPSMDLVILHLGKKKGKFNDDDFLKRLFADAKLPETNSVKQKPKRGFRIFKKRNKQ